MAEMNEKILLLDTIRNHPEDFLPIVDHAWKVFPAMTKGTDWHDDPEYNLGWDAGLLDGKRPYFAESWATGGITMRTYFVSAKGMEDAKTSDLVKLLTGAGLFRPRNPGKPRAEKMKFTDEHGSVFFSVNVTMEDENGTYTDGGTMYPFRELNAYNRKKKKEAKANEPE